MTWLADMISIKHSCKLEGPKNADIYLSNVIENLKDPKT